MSAVPIPTRNISEKMQESRVASTVKHADWMRIGTGATLLAGSLLLLTGKRRAGLLVTAAGTALAVLEHRETVAEWWEALPRHLDKAQHMIEQAQSTIEDLGHKREQIMALFGR